MAPEPLRQHPSRISWRGPRTNVKWISSLSDSDRLEIHLTFGFRCWWLNEMPLGVLRKFGLGTSILVCTTSLCKSEATVWSFCSHLFEAKPTNLKYYLPQSESDWSKLLLWICWLGLGRVSLCARTKTARTSPRLFAPSVRMDFAHACDKSFLWTFFEVNLLSTSAVLLAEEFRRSFRLQCFVIILASTSCSKNRRWRNLRGKGVFKGMFRR